jgi:hypothetical protein
MGRDGQAIARRALILLLAFAAVSTAHAQDQDKPKKKRVQPAPAAAAPLQPAPAPNPLLRPPPQLRSAVRSSSSRPAVIGRSTTAQCRAQCSEQRLGCLGNPEDTSSCNPNWTQCLSTCAGLGYGRATNP